MIGNLCILPEGGTDWQLFTALRTTLSLDDAMDLAEINEVGRSIRDAAEANIEAASAQQREREGRRRGR